MGMFDSVYFPCPSEGCDGTIEFQSKAGDCFLAGYSPDEVPTEIAADIAGDTSGCSKCGDFFTVAKALPDTVPMRLIGHGEEVCRHCGK